MQNHVHLIENRIRLIKHPQNGASNPIKIKNKTKIWICLQRIINDSVYKKAY